MKKNKLLTYASSASSSIKLCATAGLLCLGLGTANAQSITDLYDFTGGSYNGSYPQGSLALSGTTLYGMTSAGGLDNDGTIFSVLTTSPYTYTYIMYFTGTGGTHPGANPTGSLVVSGSTLYGMTSEGGAHNMGDVFSVQTNGTGYTDLLDFNGTNGENPYGSLILLGSTLYGMTYDGGAHGDGNIFSISTTGTGYTDLFDFNGSDGMGPYGTLGRVGTTLYGTTSAGGPAYNGTTSDGYGVVFSITTSGTSFTNLVNFNGSNGSYPHGDVVLAGNVLYGMTEDGGAHSDGTVFSVSTLSSHTYTDLLDFNGSNGNAPNGGLLLEGSTLYGMTEAGGADGGGNIFSISTTGTNYTDLYDFNPYSATDGLYPLGNLTFTPDNLFGLTYNGGSSGEGNVFKLATCTLWVQPEAFGCETETVSGSGGITPYTYLWEPTGATTGTIDIPTGDTYTVTVTDKNGCTATALSATGMCGGRVLGVASIDAASNIAAYPNPNRGQFTIAGVEKGMLIETYDYTGRLVNTTTATDETMQVNIANQANGIYLIRILSADGALVKQTKIIKTQ